MTLYNEKKYNECIKNCEELLLVNKRNIILLDLLAASYGSINETKKAQEYALQSIKISPNIVSYSNLALSYKKLGNNNKAKEYYEEAIKIDNKHIEAHMFLGIFYNQEYATCNKAKKHYEEAIKIDNGHIEAHMYLSMLLFKDNNIQGAEKICKRVIELNDNYKRAYCKLGVIHLLKKEYKKGFELYRARYDINNNKRFSSLFIETNLLTKDIIITNKIIFIYKEQGVGDFLQFIRFLPLLENKNPKKIVISIDKELVRLMEFNYPHLNFIEKLKVSNFDYHFPIMDFGYLLDIEINNIPYSNKYLKIDKSDSKKFFVENFNKNSKKTIGIVYKGNLNHENDMNRSIQLIDFIACLDNILSKYAVYSLQYDTTKEEKEILKNNSIATFKNINNFYDTALAIDNLDYIISVDTSVVHLSGAMGKPTFVLLPFTPDWRWGLEDNKTEWYDSVTLFRQQEVNNWSTVFSEVKNHLNTL
jgi:tetratricopeptide (TPR) repeat protein